MPNPNRLQFVKILHARLGRRACEGTFTGALALLAFIAPPAMGGTERFVVVGGGVCGVTCCQVLSASLVHPGGAPMDAKVAKSPHSYLPRRLSPSFHLQRNPTSQGRIPRPLSSAHPNTPR